MTIVRRLAIAASVGALFTFGGVVAALSLERSSSTLGGRPFLYAAVALPLATLAALLSQLGANPDTPMPDTFWRRAAAWAILPLVIVLQWIALAHPVRDLVISLLTAALTGAALSGIAAGIDRIGRGRSDNNAAA